MSSLENRGTIYGKINSTHEIHGKITGNIQLGGLLNPVINLQGSISDGEVGALTGKIGYQKQLKGVIELPKWKETEIYNGDYIITPKIIEQSVKTRSKLMKDNVVVKAIPYFETSNQTGKTVYIGGE